ncbi:hypothetical protein GCM10010840_13170 [Deinococcus aerolatus]|uniref:Uncharacterized protein n=1 Tax=Deinococcus aerolatus TaxID=522487 RepID=A0ABQ2G5X6_9DEIO|nr:hypothetical protein [Deinococcus aerolatus]GGL76395.1 hypothetical protein GCM10010840_13170 [Deinococcus aerolatus]
MGPLTAAGTTHAVPIPLMESFWNKLKPMRGILAAFVLSGANGCMHMLLSQVHPAVSVHAGGVRALAASRTNILREHEKEAIPLQLPSSRI